MDSDNFDVAERDPSGRYVRFNEILGKGASKTVYKAFDESNGIEVAWNQVHIDEIIQSPEQLQRLSVEVHLLKSLKHENIIKCYYSWVDDVNQTVNMITEFFTSGSLRKYRKKHRNVELKAIKSWATQVLRGLLHLHSHNPPVIHRDLKCDNIFVNGNAGQIKIGDLGLATVMAQPTAHSVIGTPEFMAPELYDEEYNELVDIYSFGMCMLEMVTCELPYGECQNQAQIYKKVTSGIKPASLEKVADPRVKQFIEKCLVPAPMRPSAAELLKDPFFAPAKVEVTGMASPTKLCSDNIPELAPLPKPESHSMDVDHDVSKKPGAFSESKCESLSATVELSKSNNFSSFNLVGKKQDDSSVSMKLRIVDMFGELKNIHFIFYLSTDTTLSIAAEMVIHLELPKEDVALIAGLMDDLIKKLVSASKGSSMDEAESLVLSQCMKGLSAQESLTAEVPSDHAWFDCAVHSKISDSSCSAVSDAFSLLSTSPTPTPTLLENGKCDELMMELAAIDSQYQQQMSELMKKKADAIENAKRKWVSRKIPASCS